MKPPYYHAIFSALQLQDRYGLVRQTVDEEAEAIRKCCLESQYGNRNKAAWVMFIDENPTDKAAIYMRQFVSN